MIPLFTRFYKRACIVRIGVALTIANLDQDGPRISFSISRANRQDPDTGTIRLWNLKQETRDAIRLAYTADDSLRVRLAVGYERVTKVIFDAQAYDVEPGKFDGPDIVTQLTVGDGVDAYREGFINESFAPGSELTTPLFAIASAMKLRIDPTSIALYETKITQSILKATSGPFILQGKAADSLDVLCAMTGLRWFIRDNTIVFQDTRAFLDDFAVILSPRTGLLWNEEPHFLDQIKARSLLNPDLQPGRQFKLLDEFGRPVGAPAYAIESIRYQGDTHGGVWIADIEEGRAIAT